MFKNYSPKPRSQLEEYITQEANHTLIKEICLNHTSDGYYSVKEDAFVQLRSRGFTPEMVFETLTYKFYLDENFVTNIVTQKYKQYLNNVSNLNV